MKQKTLSERLKEGLTEPGQNPGVLATPERMEQHHEFMRLAAIMLKELKTASERNENNKNSN
jgi:hypothetical protein